MIELFILLIVACVILFILVGVKQKTTVEINATSFAPEEIYFDTLRYNGDIYTFNASIAEDNGELLVARRLIKHDKRLMASLDFSRETYEDVEDSLLVTHSGMIEITKPDKSKILKKIKREEIEPNFYPSGYEDPRIFSYNGSKWIIAYKRSNKIFEGFKHKIVVFSIEEPEKEFYLDYPERNFLEKNWMPFEWKGNLMILYSFSPYVILRVDPKTWKCEKYFEKKMDTIYDVGLGSPPVLVVDKYLVMAHIRDIKKGKTIRKNFFFYIDVKTLEPGIPSEPLNFINKNIEFGTGMIVNENTVKISMGVDDCKSAILTYSLDAINSIIPKNISFENFLSAPTFIINMDKDVERYNSTIQRVKNAGFKNAERFRAVNGATDNLKEIEKYLKLNKGYNKKDKQFIKSGAKKGCTLSHISVWQKIINDNLDCAIIFEDDIIFPESWKNAKEYFEKKKNVDIIFMGNQVETKSTEMVQKIPSFCLHAYMVTNLGARKLLEVVRREPLFMIDCMTIEEMKRENCIFSYVCWINNERDKNDKRYVRNTGLVHQDRAFISTISGD